MIAADLIDGALVVVVTIDGDRARRRTFLTLGAAERAVQRAEAAGRRAEVVLAKLVPVRTIVGLSRVVR